MEPGVPIIEYTVGKHALFLNNSLALLAAPFCSSGYDVVLDHVVTNDATITGLAERIDSRPAYPVGVQCDAATVMARLRDRGDRPTGLPAGQIAAVHREPRLYDLTVDSSTSAPDDLADEILAFADRVAPMAFWRIATSARLHSGNTDKTST